MSIDMYLSEARTQADSVATRCDSRVKGYESLQKAISDFYFNSQGLSGKTYDSAKEYFMSVLYPLAQGGVLLSEATKEAVKRFPEEYTARVDTCDWKESELIERLTQIDQQIRTLYDIRSNIEYYPMPDLIKTTLLYANEEQIQLYQDMHNVFSEKLDRLREFNASSPNIFSEIDALESSVKQGLAQVKTSWNASSGTFMVPQDLSWVATIEKASEVANDRKFNDEIEKFLKDGGQIMVYKDRAKAKLASQNEFASDVSFADADVVIWYIVKDGVVINLAEHPEFKDLYRYLQKKGDKLKKDQYKTVSYNQAEKMTVDSMGGVEGRIARFEYYFRPAESAIAGVVAGVTTAKAIKATGKVPYGDMDKVTKKKNPDYSKLKNTDNFKDNTANHILGGEVNKKGKAVGYHTENNLHDDLDVKLSNVTAPDEFDVYKANVTINGTIKKGESSFFPKDWSNQKIIDEINRAYSNRVPKINPKTGAEIPGKFVGKASNGIEIEIKIKGGKIDTAYPTYKEK